MLSPPYDCRLSNCLLAGYKLGASAALKAQRQASGWNKIDHHSYLPINSIAYARGLCFRGDKMCCVRRTIVSINIKCLFIVARRLSVY